MHVLHVVGARPNFMKAAPVMAALGRREGVRQSLVHTGQHYDANMSDIFFRQLEMPKPDVSLEVGSGSHAVQTAEIMIKFEATLLERKPDLVLVYGDVNSTVAAALVAAKLRLPIGHVEAGLRSFDRDMPEELNRIVTDQLADVLFTPSADGDENLANEGIARERIVCVGNVMIDTLIRLLPKAKMPSLDGLNGDYALVTLHRPSNVDDPAVLRRILSALVEISTRCTIVFPLHPRTRQRIESLGEDLSANGQIIPLDPVGYTDCLALQRNARMVITDSGGLQEETTFLGVPCLTMRENTERPITIDVGTNTLVGTDVNRLKWKAFRILNGDVQPGRVPELWDGCASERIAEVVLSTYSRSGAVSKRAA